MTRDIQFDIALSFAGEDRQYVDEVANLLKNSGVKVFYDGFEEASLWGKNLYDYLSDVYGERAFYTIMFISQHYARKLWTNHERQAMQARAFQEHSEYILPARFDETVIPGVLPITGYISLRNLTPKDFVKLVNQKLVQSGRTVPSKLVRAAVYSVESQPRQDPLEATVNVADDNGDPVYGANLVAIADNDTFKETISSDIGIAKFSIKTRRMYRLLIAHPAKRATVIEQWDPAQDICVTLQSSENTGSAVCQSSGYIPGLKGRLNPISDTSNRLYLYADNIAVRSGDPQPALFEVGVPFLLEDADGTIMQVTVIHIQGQTSLLEFTHVR